MQNGVPKKRWSHNEDELLKKIYLKDWDEIIAEFPERTKKSIVHRMNKLNLHRPREILDDEMKEYILEQILYKTANEIARDLGVSKTTIWRYLEIKGIDLNRSKWVLTDIKVSNDSIFSIESVYTMDMGEGDQNAGE